MGGLHTFSDITLTIHHNHYFIMKTKFLSLLLLLVMGLSASTATAQTQTPQPTIDFPCRNSTLTVLRGVAANGRIKFFSHGKLQPYVMNESDTSEGIRLYDNQWKESHVLQPKFDTNEYKIDEFRFYDVDNTGFYDNREEYYFTQTLFNDDEEYEFLITNSNKGEVHLINERGERLYTFRSSKEDHKLKAKCLALMFDKLYLVFTREERLGYENDGYQLYEINPQSKTVGIKQVAANAPMMSFFSQQPNHRSLRLDLAHPAKAGQTLVVTDMSGRRVAQQILEAGQKQVSISTHRLPSATYNFTLLENGRVLENGKVIVQ